MQSSRKFYFLVVFVSGLVFGICLLTASKLFFSKNYLYGDSISGGSNQIVNPDEENYFKYFPMFKETYYILKKEFYDKNEVTTKKLFYGAIKGMMESANDPYTVFMEPNQTKDFTTQVSGSFGGLGITIDMRDNWLTVVSPLEDTPAWKAGIKSGDKIIEIEGKTTKDLPIEEAMNKLRGKPGTRVTITIQREGIKDPFQVSLVREEIKIKTVKFDMIPFNSKNYAYIRIIEFSVPTGEEFKVLLKKALEKHPDGLIIDLRNNPGGLLDVVVSCANDFIDQGLIVYTRGRVPDNNRDYMAMKEEAIVPLDLPIVVMINQGSASASEIFAGAMQDTQRAVLVGFKSFGKGSVQKTFPFQDDGSLIKYTVAKYFTPSGVCIDKIGLKPDVESKIWYELLSDDEKNSLVKVQNTNFIKDFLSANPKAGEKQVLEFQKSLETQGLKIGTTTLKYLLKMKKMENETPKVYDSEFDNQLDKALDVLHNYKDYKKPLKYYFEAK